MNEQLRPNKSDSLEALYTDRLRTIFSLYEEAGVDARLVGSLGRHASMKKPPTNFEGDYEALRDIDVVVLNPTPSTSEVTTQAKNLSLPIQLDVHFSDQIVYQSDHASISYKDATEKIDSEVLARYEGELFGLSIPTFDPKTLFHLSALKGPMRPKDFRNSRHFLKESIDTSSLPEEAFTPFHNLNRQRRQQYRVDRIMGDIRWQYHKKIPRSLRSAVSVVTIPIYRAIIRAK